MQGPRDSRCSGSNKPALDHLIDQNASQSLSSSLPATSLNNGSTQPRRTNSIGAGAIELAGARTPPPHKKNDSRGTGAQHNLWGTCKNKKSNEKPNIEQRKWSACHPLATDTLPLINSFVDHTVFYVGAESSQTPLQFVDNLPVSQSGKRNPESTPIFCSRLVSGLVHSSRWPKILKHFSKLLK